MISSARILLITYALTCIGCAGDLQPNILGERWRFIGIEAVIGGADYFSSADTIYLTFPGPDSLNGLAQGLCGNRYEGRIKMSGYNQLIVLGIGSTEAACNGSRYWDYIEALGKVSGFDRQGNVLRLHLDANRRDLLFYRG